MKCECGVLEFAAADESRTTCGHLEAQYEVGSPIGPDDLQLNHHHPSL